MLSKCIGIISYFPNGPLRDIRKENFNNLIKTLNDYFKLPIIIIAQNWKEEDFNIKYCSTIKIYRWNGALGITGARIALREKLLKENYDYSIWIDDDINIKCNAQSVNAYLREIDKHPDMFGQVKKLQLFAISYKMLKLMDFDFIRKYESYRGEIWEDVAYYKTYTKLYGNKFYNINIPNLILDFMPSEKDTSSTWYYKEINQNLIQKNTNKIINEWTRNKANDLYNNVR